MQHSPQYLKTVYISLKRYLKVCKSVFCLLKSRIVILFYLGALCTSFFMYVKVIDISVGTTLQGTTTILFNYVRDTSKITILFELKRRHLKIIGFLFAVTFFKNNRAIINTGFVFGYTCKSTVMQ